MHLLSSHLASHSLTVETCRGSCATVTIFEIQTSPSTQMLILLCLDRLFEASCLIFITLAKWKQAPSKKATDRGTKALEELEKQGIKVRMYWTLGRYDSVTITEAPTEKDAMKVFLPWQAIIESETMVGVPREEAIKLL